MSVSLVEFALEFFPGIFEGNVASVPVVSGIDNLRERMSVWAVEVVVEFFLGGFEGGVGTVPLVSGIGMLRGRMSVWFGEVAREEVIHDVRIIPSRAIFKAWEVYVPGIEDRRGLDLDTGALMMGSCGAGIIRGSIIVARIPCVRTIPWALQDATKSSEDVAVGAVELTDCVFAETAGWKMIDFYIQVAWAA